MLKYLELGDLISVQSNHSSKSDTSLLKANINSYNFIQKDKKNNISKISKQNLLDKNLKTIISTGIFMVYELMQKKVFCVVLKLHFDNENKKWFTKSMMKKKVQKMYKMF